MITQPRTFGLFDKRIAGDDSLLELARVRFERTGLAPEIHAGQLEVLDGISPFLPQPRTAVMVHLPRELDWASEPGQARIVEFASRCAGRVRGFIVHDDRKIAPHPQPFVRAAEAIDARLRTIPAAPTLFIEYAAGLDPRVFAAFFAGLRELERVGPCIDTGHVGMWRIREDYARMHRGADVCALKGQPDELRGLLGDVQTAVASARPCVVELIQALGALGKPMHFHLHDGHPLSTASPFGVSDHLSFLARIPVRFDYQGRHSLPPMFGPEGLADIVRAALGAVPAGPVSFTLEIHPTFDRLELGDAAPLFSHWKDKTNAEQMNHWLDILSRNHHLVQDACVPGPSLL